MQFSKIYALGPAGTFSDIASQKVCGSATVMIYTQTFTEALKKTAADPQSVAVAPIENSVAGIVSKVQELLVSEGLVILGEIILPVRYALFSNGAPNAMKKIFAHPQAFEQTSEFVSINLPEVSVEFTHSNVDSGHRYLKECEGPLAVGAIVPIAFAEQHKSEVKFWEIQDYKNNTTRFLIVANRKNRDQFDFSQTKTSLYVEFAEDRAGLLYELLSIFRQFGINLCRLESRPSKKTPWFYVFFVDFINNDKTELCLAALAQAHVHYLILGSYSLVE